MNNEMYDSVIDAFESLYIIATTTGLDLTKQIGEIRADCWSKVVSSKEDVVQMTRKSIEEYLSSILQMTTELGRRKSLSINDIDFELSQRLCPEIVEERIRMKPLKEIINEMKSITLPNKVKDMCFDGFEEVKEFMREIPDFPSLKQIMINNSSPDLPIMIDHDVRMNINDVFSKIISFYNSAIREHQSSILAYDEMMEQFTLYMNRLDEKIQKISFVNKLGDFNKRLSTRVLYSLITCIYLFAHRTNVFYGYYSTFNKKCEQFKELTEKMYKRLVIS